MATETAPTETKKPLLSITTLVQHEFIRIDGEAYDLRSLNVLSRLDRVRLATIAKELQPLNEKHQAGQLTDPEENQRLDDLLDAFCRTVIDAPADVHGKLLRVHRLDIVLTFMGLSLPSLRQARAAKAGASRSTTSKRRRGSRGSTAARRRRG